MYFLQVHHFRFADSELHFPFGCPFIRFREVILGYFTVCFNFHLPQLVSRNPDPLLFIRALELGVNNFYKAVSQRSWEEDDIPLLLLSTVRIAHLFLDAAVGSFSSYRSSYYVTARFSQEPLGNKYVKKLCESPKLFNNLGLPFHVTNGAQNVD